MCLLPILNVSICSALDKLLSTSEQLLDVYNILSCILWSNFLPCPDEATPTLKLFSEDKNNMSAKSKPSVSGKKQKNKGMNIALMLGE